MGQQQKVLINLVMHLRRIKENAKKQLLLPPWYVPRKSLVRYANVFLQQVGNFFSSPKFLKVELFKGTVVLKSSSVCIHFLVSVCKSSCLCVYF